MKNHKFCQFFFVIMYMTQNLFGKTFYLKSFPKQSCLWLNHYVAQNSIFSKNSWHVFSYTSFFLPFFVFFFFWNWSHNFCGPRSFENVGFYEPSPTMNIEAVQIDLEKSNFKFIHFILFFACVKINIRNLFNLLFFSKCANFIFKK